jgi:hypothetical protein
VEPFFLLRPVSEPDVDVCLQSIDSGWAQDKTGDEVGANTQAEDLLDLRGDVPNPRRIDAHELQKLPRAETRTTDPHDPGKEIVYSGTPLVEVLKAGCLLLDPDMAAIRETVTMTVLVETRTSMCAIATGARTWISVCWLMRAE